ncbi:hypothetical protein V6N12_054446 [Hibiscus sabdariffa]|uniref:Uncharacterized protein n=1 Tax=Hibiscus sabdariffa TaxID=183260 RepID=A0ABR2D0G1_9ROSI
MERFFLNSIALSVESSLANYSLLASCIALKWHHGIKNLNRILLELIRGDISMLPPSPYPSTQPASLPWSST